MRRQEHSRTACGTKKISEKIHSWGRQSAWQIEKRDQSNDAFSADAFSKSKNIAEYVSLQNKETDTIERCNLTLVLKMVMMLSM
jgi:hypothetical protein